jgi:hypothetical protein
VDLATVLLVPVAVSAVQTLLQLAVQLLLLLALLLVEQSLNAVQLLLVHLQEALLLLFCEHFVLVNFAHQLVVPGLRVAVVVDRVLGRLSGVALLQGALI